MHVFRYTFYVLALGVLAAGCKSTQTTTTTTQTDSYQEDLSVLRPKIETLPTVETPTEQKKEAVYVEPKISVNRQLDGVLDSINRINLSRNAVDGFTIQVYSGKREEALNAKKTLTGAFPELESEVHFTEPIFRVKIGKYYTRLEAQEDYSEIKRYFPAAIIIPEKISVK